MEQTIPLCGSKKCCPTMSVDGECIIIADGDNFIKLDKEASDKLREIIISDFLKYMVVDYVLASRLRIPVEEEFTFEDVKEVHDS